MFTVHRYQVILCTGDKAGTALDSRVYLTVSGARGDTGKRALKKTTPDAPEKQADQKAETNRVSDIELNSCCVSDAEYVFGVEACSLKICLKCETCFAISATVVTHKCV